MAVRLGLRVEIHPPSLDTLRAHCRGDVVRERLPYLERDRAMVRAVEQLVACPRTSQEDEISGTWTTVRYARQARKPVVIVLPGGTVLSERLPWTPAVFAATITKPTLEGNVT